MGLRPPMAMKVPNGVAPAKLVLREGGGAGAHGDGFPLPAFAGTSFAGMT
jgi:hypothetical protein